MYPYKFNFIENSQSCYNLLNIKRYSIYNCNVLLQESDLLDDFMSLAGPDLGSRQPSATGSLTDLTFCGSLTELDNLPRQTEVSKRDLLLV